MADTHCYLPIEPCTILQVEAWDKTLPAFEAELSRQLGAKLPAAVGETESLGGWAIIRVAPRRFWLVANEKARLSCSIEPELGSQLWLSEGRLRLRLSGPHTFDILRACVAIDWQAEEAKPGRAVQTSFHHVPVVVMRTAEDACDLLVPRSFAQSLGEWVAEVAAPFVTGQGLIVGAAPHLPAGILSP
ncbi:sarcosine oxidase subunit gamma family protein [Mesorhizobium sp. BAC0120]|uniref:sarcosine oxidase subunit gamma n=1 Tax=Mesorhizobium sp. BAC0120 TaxID=3090670 RepID=UPI00298C3685|nr:sarcosine oxidase subunit gamma family protein [Mesorhizobium sp. BAC0120]MDW6023460.1 sarcosine oxidase subunit gamma family protein [Mesorhizobium sp. BAC0120]